MDIQKEAQNYIKKLMREYDAKTPEDIPEERLIYEMQQLLLEMVNDFARLTGDWPPTTERTVAFLRSARREFPKFCKTHDIKNKKFRRMWMRAHQELADELDESTQQ